MFSVIGILTLGTYRRILSILGKKIYSLKHDLTSVNLFKLTKLMYSMKINPAIFNPIIFLDHFGATHLAFINGDQVSL